MTIGFNPDGLLMTYDWSAMQSAFDAECDDQHLEGLDRLMHKMPVMMSEDIKPSEYALKASAAMGASMDHTLANAFKSRAINNAMIDSAFEAIAANDASLNCGKDGGCA